MHIEFDVCTSALRVRKSNRDGQYYSSIHSNRRVGGHWVEITVGCEDNPQHTRFSALAWEAVVPSRPPELVAAQIKMPRNLHHSDNIITWHVLSHYLSQGKGKYSSVGFSTVFGHLMEGEERFSVEFRDQDSTVWLDLFSVSRGHGILGKVGLICATCGSVVGQVHD